MERLDKPHIKFRILYSPIWPVLAFIFFICTVIMTGLFIWMVAKTCQQPRNVPTTEPNPSNFDVPCPRQPSLFALPNPLPKAIKDSLTVIDDHLKSLAKNAQNKSAISVNVFYRDKVIWRGHYGSKIYKGSVSPDDNTRYRIGSVTKIFPVMLLYKLSQDGIISSLDDPLSKYAPNFHIKNPFTRSNITLRQIASQMSGLPREAACGYNCNATNSSEQLQLLESEYLVVEPWTSPSYSNLGYALLGRLLTENLLNITFEEWVEKEVLQPLGMNNTGFQITEKVLENMALPYESDGKVLPFMNVGWAAPDFITRDGMWLWGSPWEMRFVKDFVARQKGGNIDSYNAVLSVIPEMKLGLSVLINVAPVLPRLRSSSFAIADLIHNTLLPALNKTLFEMKRHQSFPVDSKKFLGKFSVTQISRSTREKITYTMIIKNNMDTLLASVNTNNSKVSPGFIIKYVGKPLLFQATVLNAVNSTCLVPHLGLLGMVKFDAPGPEGLCSGFSLTYFDRHLVAKRSAPSENKAAVNKENVSLRENEDFLFDYLF